jgi:hypothetical protein
MSAPINDGGTEIQSTGSSVNVGLQVSLRDYFAAAALQAMDLTTQHTFLEYAQDAYQFADAMIKARGESK